MEALRVEVAKNADTFIADVIELLENSRVALSSESSVWRSAYEGAVTLQAWRVSILERCLSVGALAFFTEAQNDALSAISLALHGLWRPSLQVLRSVIENVQGALYYADHPVELELWQMGRHRLSFSEYQSYFERHPRYLGSPADLQALPKISQEYGELSRAVHASSAPYRMTGTSYPEVSTANLSSLGMWRTRYGKSLSGINLLLLALYRDELQGSAVRSLRKCISLVLGADVKQSIKSNWAVSLFS